MSFKGHKVTLFLSRELERALVQVRADKDLGRSFAGLLCFVEGLHQMKYISEDIYRKYQARYSTPLTKSPNEARNQKSDLKTLEIRFSVAIKNWSTMTEKARQWYRNKAEEYRDKIGNAEMILALAGKEPVELMSHG